MGVYHFMGVGQAIGAVTCAVDYVERCLSLAQKDKSVGDHFFLGSGGINHEDQKGQIEALVLFSSKQVIDNSLKAFSYQGCNAPSTVRNEIEKNLRNIWKSIDTDEGRKIFWVEVDINNFQDCFDKALKVSRRFSGLGKQGKEIWLNLTGGSNSINLALLTMARFTGIATKHYLIHQKEDYRTEICVPSFVKPEPNKDGYFTFIPFLHTNIDTTNFYEVLLELSSCAKPINTVDLFDRIRGKNYYFPSKNIDEFKRVYMLKLFGLGYTNFDKDNELNSLTALGKKFIDELERMELEYAFSIGDLLKDDANFIEESKHWSWFHSPVKL